MVKQRGLNGWFSAVLVAATASALLGTAGLELAEQTNASAWKMVVLYDVDGKRISKQVPYDGFGSAVEAVKMVDAEGGKIVRLSSGNDEMGIENPDFDVDSVREIMRRQSL